MTATLTDTPNSMKIAIVGVGKSGTTALYYKLLNSLGEEARGIFEPKRVDQVTAELPLNDTLVVKALLRLMPPEMEALFRADFDKRILIVRDPRDTIVSALLYTAAYDFLWNKRDSEICAAIELLRRKERLSNSASVISLMARMRDGFDLEEYAGMIRELASRLDKLAAPSSSYQVYRYEDMISGDFTTLEEYLGFSITSGNDVAKEHSRVVRTKGSGSWRLWFCAEDIAYFKPLFQPMMVRFGYDVDDWAFDTDAQIDPAISSEYVIRIINERRTQHGKVPCVCP